jgi:hypothetical protein
MQQARAKTKEKRLPEDLHSSISQTDSMIPIRKDSHSSKYAIFATRLDTSPSRLDTYFIRSWDLPALSKAICAWHFIKDRRLSRSEILDEYSSHRQKERGGKEVLESNMLTGDKARLRPNDSPAGSSWKSSKKKEDIHLRNIIQAKHFMNRKIFTISAKAP